MSVSRRDFLAVSLAAGVAAPSVRAQQAPWPNRAIKIVAPTPPAGPTDRVGRLLAQELAKAFKQSFVVENRAGAGGIVGTAAVAKAAPDGYTFLLISTLNTIAPGLYKEIPYDIVNDFAHISPLTQSAQLFVVRADHPARTLAEFIDLAKEKPNAIDYASSGAGSTGHLTMELFQRESGIRLGHIPYKGAAQALQDVVGGMVPALVIAQETVLPFVQNGKLRVLAVSSKSRSRALPDVPTFAESGFPNLVTIAWIGLSAPKGTPADVVQRVHAAMLDVSRNSDVVAQLEPGGFTPFTTPTPAAFAEIVRKDTQRYGQIIKAAGIQQS